MKKRVHVEKMNYMAKGFPPQGRQFPRITFTRSGDGRKSRSPVKLKKYDPNVPFCNSQPLILSKNENTLQNPE
jgi:hypothetical protein